MWRFYFGAYLGCVVSFLTGMYLSSRILAKRERRVRQLIARLTALRMELLQHSNTRAGRDPFSTQVLTDFERDCM